ncbi:hypothetical protein [Halosimplex salinum]|uniref:hypothetical protein n=1 Tax=Halosimplex salinum TaxID=1710538 RepID=UPI0013DE62F3|nr:hypothetical protein [Halosimplex salinum]
MSSHSPETRIEASPTGAVASALRRGGVAALVGVAVGVLLRSLLAQYGVGAPSLAVLVGVTAVVAASGVLALAATRAAGTSVRFGRDRLAVAGDGPFGPLVSETTVDYDDVDLVLRRDTGGDRRVGTASYELVRSGELTVRLNHCADPETVERELDRRVPTPRDRADTVDEDAVRTALQHERVFWRDWPSDEPVPRSAVVTSAELVEQYRASKTPEPSEPTGPSAANDEPSSSVTAADFENGNFAGGGGGGDADFTGGSARHSPGHASNEGGAEGNVGSDEATDMHDGGI